MSRTGLWITALLAGACVTAFAQETPRQYRLRENQPSTGSNIRQDTAFSKSLPLNKRYEELSPEERDLIKSWYEPMAEGDEPPFPADGLAPILKALGKGQERLGVRGKLTLYVDVDADGEPLSVSAVDSPNARMTQFAAQVLMLTKFKPARCAGAPCRMQYPFWTLFVLK
jgi:hypothetical protein